MTDFFANIIITVLAAMVLLQMAFTRWIRKQAVSGWLWANAWRNTYATSQLSLLHLRPVVEAEKNRSNYLLWLWKTQMVKEANGVLDQFKMVDHRSDFERKSFQRKCSLAGHAIRHHKIFGEWP